MASFAFYQLILNAPELLQRSLQALNNPLARYRRVGQVIESSELSFLEPENVQAGLTKLKRGRYLIRGN